ncbi:MAG TPA: hypothetical protein VJG83_04370 [archaeon]|nr:hypothetical protein [archaeon]
MVFVNLDKKPSASKPTSVKNSYSSRRYKCMNCGKDIEYPTGSIDARRFCSTKCKEQYFAPSL